MPGKLEKELIKATKFKQPKGGFKERQDELAAIAKAATKLPDDDFDDLSTEAADWVNDAVKAVNDKATIEEFPDDAGSASEDDAEEARDAEADEDDTEQEPQDGTEGSKDDLDADAQAEADAEASNEAEEAQEAVKPARKGAAKKKLPTPQAFRKKVTELVPASKLAHIKTRYDDLTGEQDRFGVVMGTKTHDAVKMYERGTTSVELMEKLDGRYYNILKRLSQAGHLVERDGAGVFTLTHKDDISEKQAREKAEKAAKKKGKRK